ncbi:MAG: winged helix-turn-helix domain-containing protein [Planctomycetota bacterium]
MSKSSRIRLRVPTELREGTRHEPIPPPGSPLPLPTDKQADPPRVWTFLTNHAHVLIALSAEPRLTLREVADRVGITERAVQRIVQELEAEGFLTREKVGRTNRYQVNQDVSLRHPIEAHRTIGDLLDLVSKTES